MGSPLLLRIVESLGPPLIRLLGSTVRVKVIPAGVEKERRARGQNAIFALWHGRLLVPLFSHRMLKIAILISRHRDGEYIARVVERLGFVPVRGSSTRGGVAGMVGLVRMARAGHDLAFTPDGPRGPRYQVQRGVIYAASRTGLPLVPSAVEVDRAWVLGSWDEFTIPKPFSRVVILQGEPIHVPPRISGEELERTRHMLEVEMVRLMGIARGMTARKKPGRPPSGKRG